MTRTMLVYGDSNSHGTPPMPDWNGSPRFDRQTRWPGVAAAALGSGWHVIEEGLPGRTTVLDDLIEGPHRNGALVLPAILGSHAPLDLVVVMLGTNDLKQAFALTPHEIGDGVEKLVKIILGAECGPGGAAPQILLVVPPPILEAGCLQEMFAGGAAKSARLLPEYQAIAAKWGTGLLDAGKVIVSSPIDGVHFAAGEHAKLGRAVAQAVELQMGKA
jgi:lysophospholipase L1-like esterase